MTELATADVLTHDEAERLTQRIGLKLGTLADSYESVQPLLREAVERRAHEALGYANFTIYAAERWRDQLTRLDVDVRRAVERELAEAGLSRRAIAPIVGVSHMQVTRDLQVEPDVTPEPEPDNGALTGDVLDPEPEPISKTDGLDGKQYTRKPRKKPVQQEPAEDKEEQIDEPKPRRKPLPAQMNQAGVQLRTAVERLEALSKDNRFNTHKQEVAPHLRSHLTYAIQCCQLILDRINT